MWKRLLPVLGGLALFAVVFRHVDWPKTWEYLRTADLFLCFAALVCFIVMNYLKAVRWSYLIRMQGARYPVWDCFLVYMSTLALGNLTPGRAGDFAKVFFLNKDLKFTSGMSMTSVLVDRVFDLYLLLILGCAGILVYPMPIDPNLIKAVWFFFGVLVLVTILAFNQRIGGVLLKAIFQRLMKQEHKHMTNKLFDDFHKGMASFYRPAIFYPTLLSIVSYIVFFGGCYLLASSIQMPINILYLTFCMSVVNIVSLVTFLGLGTRDAALLILFKLVGFQDQAEAYSMLLFFVGVILFSLVGLGCYALKPFDTSASKTAPVRSKTARTSSKKMGKRS